MPMSAPSDSIDHSTDSLFFVCSVSRSFQVAGIAGSCHTRARWRTRMSAIQRLYPARSSSVGVRSVVRLPRVGPPAAIGNAHGRADPAARARQADGRRAASVDERPYPGPRGTHALVGVGVERTNGVEHVRDVLSGWPWIVDLFA